jgi:GGDEF domain-containing protein
MGETSKTIEKNMKNKHQEGVYSRFDVSVEKIKSALQLIKSNIPDSVNGELELDQSILDACMETTFFLGKLEELNFIITKGRKEVNDLIENIIIKVMEDVGNLLKEEGISHEKITGVMREKGKMIKTWIDMYMDKFAGQRFLEELSRQYNERLHIYGYDHFMTFMTRAVSNSLVELKKESSENLQEDVKKLRSVATLFFDLDGLKMLNDMSLGGYNSGDKALWVMARALTNPVLLTWAKKQGIELVPTHRSGDEFLLGVVAKEDVDLGEQQNGFTGVNGEAMQNISYLKYIGEYVKKTVQNFEKIDMKHKDVSRAEESNKRKQPINPPKSITDIIDFFNNEQREKFEEIRKKMPKKLQEIFNESFTYQLDCSYGYATLEDGLKSNIHGKINFATIDYETTAFELTGAGMVNVASDKMKINKKYGRSERVRSQELTEQVYEILYRTGREQRGWNIDKEDFAEIEKVLFEFRDEIMELKESLAKAGQKLKKQEHREALGMNQFIDGLNQAIGILQGENEETTEHLKKIIDNIKNGE